MYISLFDIHYNCVHVYVSGLLIISISPQWKGLYLRAYVLKKKINGILFKKKAHKQPNDRNMCKKNDTSLLSQKLLWATLHTIAYLPISNWHSEVLFPQQTSHPSTHTHKLWLDSVGYFFHIKKKWLWERQMLLPKLQQFQYRDLVAGNFTLVSLLDGSFFFFNKENIGTSIIGKN